MRTDEDFLTDLRTHVDDVAPVIAVDTGAVVPRARRRRFAARSAATVAAAALVAGGVLGAQALAPDPVAIVPADPTTDGPVDGSVTEATPSDPLLTAEYWYVEQLSPEDDGSPRKVQEWIGREQPGLILYDGATDLDAEHPPTAIGPRPWFDEYVIDGERTRLTWEMLWEIPADADWLEEVFRASIEPDRRNGTDDDKIFQMATELLTGTPAPADLRLALVEVASRLPGTTVTPGAEDALGRSGTLVERRTPGGGRVLVDPDDGTLLEHAPGAVRIAEGPADDTPIEPTLEMAGCVAWETC